MLQHLRASLKENADRQLSTILRVVVVRR